jgi:hypothetical protein
MGKRHATLAMRSWRRGGIRRDRRLRASESLNLGSQNRLAAVKNLALFVHQVKCTLVPTSQVRLRDSILVFAVKDPVPNSELPRLPLSLVFELRPLFQDVD